GNFDFDALHDALQEPVSLVSVMMVNNELGYIFPIKRIVQAVRERSSSTLVHCDAVQAFGKFEVLPRELGVDLLSVASHKIGGPKGIGALYVKGGTSMHTTAFGGGQERGLRSGTEAPFLAAGFAAAIGVALDRRKESFEHVSMLRDRLVAGLHERFSNVIVNSREDGSPYIVSFAIPGIDRRSLVQDLSDRGIYVSLSSACSYNRHTVPAGTWREKHPLVLELAGVAEAARDSTLRVSFCADNTAEEVDVFLSSLSELCV
ncbi:MAG: aminotransferase class V-fold PLP-dependent enzyme, partial [Eggerthellaceae bacterium]|nr:aminotransferase class V-fold PLP-dependent enzyme [Eggerthellaceae bacterium]